MLQQVQAAPRPQPLSSAAAQEIADLRSQLEEAHAKRREQAEQVPSSKYDLTSSVSKYDLST